MDDGLIATTTHGCVRGLAERGVLLFRGIPYAAPPVGERRFQPPAPVPAWEGVRDALAFGNRALQPATALGLAPQVVACVPLRGDEAQSEDCLYLNVWTPALADGRGRPTMVWLHGGAFVAGSSGSPMYDGTSLAANEDVVVFSLNHRLGAFGFLNLAEIGGPAFASSGSAGMLDIVAALRWVRDNAAAFGGDPGNVTIFGESGGGAKVSVLLAMPEARGLFHRAIMQSGPAVEMMKPADATAVTRKVTAQVGVDAAEPRKLLDVPAERLLEAQIAIMTAQSTMSFANRRKQGFNPVIDSKHLPGGPFEPVAPSISADIPLMIGTNKDEMALFWSHTPWLENLAEAGLVDAVRQFLGERAPDIVARYRQARPGDSPRELAIAIATDQSIRLPSLVTADRKMALNAAPVFVYLFTWETPALEGRLGSAHVLEIPFMFDSLDKAAGFTGDSPERAPLARTMRAAWARFARGGDPNGEGLPRWPAYNPGRRPTMIFDTTCRVEDDPRGAERCAWAAAS